MNSFFIPRLGSQIYAMAGMQTRLHLIANEPGTYDGISASYSGPGFSGMKFKAIATPDRAEFDQWVAKAKQSPNTMSDMAAFEKLAAPSEYNQVEYFSNVKPDLFADVINKFMAHGKSMDMTQPEGEHSAHEGMEGMDMSHAESAH
ncbi:Ubiquinol oxidase subunit 2 [Shigella flexneri]|nr:COX aromatic rich motif-containing protein [Shigella flexneri]CEP59587.1 Ubiquinol oxidase subunit 2 [Shigella flexneri 2a]SRH58528.1 Ubiquinol oxidase subunit 2 [Shigella flexneri 2b]KFZ96986.1 COX Aromatic Rich Motif family protein [Shigella flexneri]SPZ89913.1 Ubiquinol oxidase subunit 2 [Shigella flexneri]